MKTATPDALTVTPSRAELWVAYHRKAIIALVPTLLAGLNILRDAAQTENGVNASTIVLAVIAVAQAVGTYYPDNARAKLVASGVLAIAGGVTAAVTQGISTASLWLVLTQFLAWAGAGAVANGAHPDVAARVPGVLLDDDSTYLGDDGTGAGNIQPMPNPYGDAGHAEVILILQILTAVGVLLLLLGISFR